jgi:hypothetical protein
MAGNVVLPNASWIRGDHDDLDHPGSASYRWLQLAKKYANYIYPPNGAGLICSHHHRLTPAPPAIHHIEVVYTDGTRDKFVPE